MFHLYCFLDELFVFLRAREYRKYVNFWKMRIRRRGSQELEETQFVVTRCVVNLSSNVERYVKNFVRTEEKYY